MARKRTPKPTIAPPVTSSPDASPTPLPDLAAFATEPVTPDDASKAAEPPPYEVSSAARDKAVAVLGEVIDGDSASIESQITAAETILKLEGMTPELEDVLVRLVDPPGDHKQRLRAARLLLGVS